MTDLAGCSSSDEFVRLAVAKSASTLYFIPNPSQYGRTHPHQGFLSRGYGQDYSHCQAVLGHRMVEVLGVQEEVVAQEVLAAVGS